MNPYDLTKDEVRSELAILIEKYPERTGKAESPTGNDNDTCVYYTDEDDVPVTYANCGRSDAVPQLKTPVCIVGAWIEAFHPSFKEDELVQNILRSNSTLSGCNEEQIPFNNDVWHVLANAQDAQDRPNARWEDIEI